MTFLSRRYFDLYFFLCLIALPVYADGPAVFYSPHTALGVLSLLFVMRRLPSGEDILRPPLALETQCPPTPYSLPRKPLCSGPSLLVLALLSLLVALQVAFQPLTTMTYVLVVASSCAWLSHFDRSAEFGMAPICFVLPFMLVFYEVVWNTWQYPSESLRFFVTVTLLIAYAQPAVLVFASQRSRRTALPVTSVALVLHHFPRWPLSRALSAKDLHPLVEEQVGWCELLLILRHLHARGYLLSGSLKRLEPDTPVRISSSGIAFYRQERFDPRGHDFPALPFGLPPLHKEVVKALVPGYPLSLRQIRSAALPGLSLWDSHYLLLQMVASCLLVQHPRDFFSMFLGPGRHRYSPTPIARDLLLPPAE